MHRASSSLKVSGKRTSSLRSAQILEPVINVSARGRLTFAAVCPGVFWYAPGHGKLSLSPLLKFIGQMLIDVFPKTFCSQYFTVMDMALCEAVLGGLYMHTCYNSVSPLLSEFSWFQYGKASCVDSIVALCA